MLHAFTVFRFLKYFLQINVLKLKEIICTMKLNSADSMTSLLNGTCSMCHSFQSFSQRSFLPFHFINLALSNSSLMFWSFESTIQQCLILLFIFTLALCGTTLFCSCNLCPFFREKQRSEICFPFYYLQLHQLDVKGAAL